MICIGLAKKLVTEKPEWTFGPTQYFYDSEFNPELAGIHASKGVNI